MNNIGTRYKRMDEFLKFWRDIAKENPNIPFNTEEVKNMIYKKLVRLGVPEEQQQNNLSSEGLFNKWTNEFENIPNINVYVSQNWRYFCQFVNKKEVFNNGNREAIKIYVPLDREHIEQGANLIFKFLAKNDIAHLSKVGKHIRVDDIVIRVSNEEDAKKILDFINKEKYIQEGLIAPNPFAYNNGKIAMVCDRDLSYNNTIASLIGIYIETAKREGKINDVKLSDFIKFSAEYHKENFQTFNNIEKTLHDFQIYDEGELTTQEKCYNILNIRDIITLFLKSTGLMYSFNNYLEQFKNSRYTNNFMNQVNNLTNIINARKKAENNQNTEEETKDFDLEKYSIEMIEAFVAKTYSKEHMLKVLSAYLETGKSSYLTNTNNLRRKISSSDFRSELLLYLKENGLSIEEYFEIIFRKYEHKILEDAVLATYKKYQNQYEQNLIKTDGASWAMGALRNLALKSSFSGFTRDENARANIKNTIDSSKAIELMRERVNLPSNNKGITDEESFILTDEYFTKVYKDQIIKKKTKHIA